MAAANKQFKGIYPYFRYAWFNYRL
jgi:hypothetical protein